MDGPIDRPTERSFGMIPPPVAVESYLESAAAHWPDKLALDFYDQRFTFGQLYDLALRVAAGLQARGVCAGDRVGLHLPNSPHYVISLFGVLLAGGVVVNLSPLAAARALRRQVEGSGAVAVLSLDAPGVLDRIAALAGKGGLKTLVVCRLDDLGPAPAVTGFSARGRMPDGAIRFTELIDNDGNPSAPKRGDLTREPAVLQFTGGTTGEPKAATLTHANFAAAMESYRQNGWEFDLPHGSTRRILVVAPMFHIVALTCSVLQSAATGATLIPQLRFDADRAIGAIANKGANVFSGVPAMYAMLVRHRRAAELSTLRYCFSSGAPFPPEVLERFNAITGITPRSGYGLTETTTAGASYPEDYVVRPGSVGVPSPYAVVEIRDVETGSRVLPRGEPGEVCIGGPQVMLGYWNRPDATAEAIRGGRFHTGDIGYFDPDGFLLLIDRKKDMILTGGFNVFPATVEAALRRHPAIDEAAVIGSPHPILGQGVKAFVTLAEGETAPSLRDLRVFLSDKLASYETPVALEVRDSLPKTDVGKPSRAALAEEDAAKRRR